MQADAGLAAACFELIGIISIFCRAIEEVSIGLGRRIGASFIKPGQKGSNADAACDPDLGGFMRRYLAQKIKLSVRPFQRQRLTGLQ